jgi:hypothetical protein
MHEIWKEKVVAISGIDYIWIKHPGGLNELKKVLTLI